MKYKTPEALRQAVKAAARKSGRDTNKAIKGFYHDRFLCRVFSLDEPAFILKGGQSMLAKIPNARETGDIDLLGRARGLDEALGALKEAAGTDLGDFIEYRFEGADPIDVSQDYREGYAVTFGAWLGGTKRVEAVSVDLVVDPAVPEEFEVVSPVGRIEVSGLETFDYLSATPENRVAEKSCAVMQVYATGPSSRVKDLADLVASMLNESVDADKLARCIEVERALRGIDPDAGFSVPHTWKTTLARNYRKLAREAALPEAFMDVVYAESAISHWLDAARSGEVAGCAWDPVRQSWAVR